MGLEYYAFALFIAGLICAIAIIFKVLFSNVKRQQKMLDERETQILQLYTSVETLMEEFNDQMKMATDELKEFENRATSKMPVFDLPPGLEEKEKVLDKLPRTVPFDANRIRVAGEVLERAERIIKNETIVNPPMQQEKEENTPVFQKFFDETAEATPPQQTAPEKPNAQSRSETILTMADEGKTDIEIASELGITRNEVQLVIGLKR